MRAAALCALLPLHAAWASSFCDAPGWARAWHDDFSGPALDAEAWNVVAGADVGSCRSALCTPGNVAVHDGALWLTTRREAVGAHNYTTGAVTTKGKRAFSPAEGGTWRGCVRARLPGAMSPPGAAQGLWPAIWWMPNDDSCDPDEGEMDVLEMVNGDGAGWSTYHWQTTWPAHNCSYPKGHLSTSAHTLLTAWNATFHEFAVERAETYLAFVYDGVTVLNTSGAGGPRPLLWDVPFYLIVNTALGGGWPGEPTAATALPAVHTIDSVTVSRAA